MDVYFKSDLHEKQTYELLNAFGVKSLTDNYEYGSFCYLVAGTYKSKDVVETINKKERTIDIEKLKDIIKVYSTSERNMIRFALQLYNQNIDNILIGDVFSSLDNENRHIVIDAIQLRF